MNAEIIAQHIAHPTTVQAGLMFLTAFLVVGLFWLISDRCVATPIVKTLEANGVLKTSEQFDAEDREARRIHAVVHTIQRREYERDADVETVRRHGIVLPMRRLQ